VVRSWAKRSLLSNYPRLRSARQRPLRRQSWNSILLILQLLAFSVPATGASRTWKRKILHPGAAFFFRSCPFPRAKSGAYWNSKKCNRATEFQLKGCTYLAFIYLGALLIKASRSTAHHFGTVDAYCCANIVIPKPMIPTRAYRCWILFFRASFS